MKKVISLALVICFMMANTVALKAESFNAGTIYLKHEWKKSADGTWAGKDHVWYKLDDKAKLWWSKDGKKWEAVKDGMWQDKSGKWLKIDANILKWSADGGKTWVEVPEWKWEGENGTWYKFDSSWNLWTMEPHNH